MPGNVQVHWPEGNVLINAHQRDPGSGVPAYKAIVSIHRLESQDIERLSVESRH